jgi:hypothetical protein
MFAIRKRDLKTFTPDAHSVCRTAEGSTNSYLEDPRVIEEFLKGIEPKYNNALARITAPSVDTECIYALSGFVAYILTCSPAGMRLQSTPLQGIVEALARRLDSQGEIPAPPPELGGTSLSELLRKGTVQIDIDPKYPQAIGISKILAFVNTFGNSSWDVLVNEHTDSPYFTTDFPVAIENTRDSLPLNRLVPLSPYLALRIYPTSDTPDQTFNFPGFRRRILTVSREDVRRINRNLVQCAEEIVFYREDFSWVLPFIRKNVRFRLETVTEPVPHGSGTLLLSTLRVRPTPKEPSNSIGDRRNSDVR